VLISFKGRVTLPLKGVKRRGVENTKIYKYYLLFFLVIVRLFFPENSECVELISNGAFCFDTTVTDCYTYQDLIESDKGSFSISIYDVLPDRSWKLKGYLEKTIPDRYRFRIFLKRTSDGLGPGKVSGGRSYLMLSDKERTLFSGTGELSDIELQMKIVELLPKFPESPFDIKVHLRVVIY
jgi:hypothetical protein